MLLEAVLVVGRGQIVPKARCCVRESSRVEYRTCCAGSPEGERHRSVACERAGVEPTGMTQSERLRDQAVVCIR